MLTTQKSLCHAECCCMVNVVLLHQIENLSVSRNGWQLLLTLPRDVNCCLRCTFGCQDCTSSAYVCQRRPILDWSVVRAADYRYRLTAIPRRASDTGLVCSKKHVQYLLLIENDVGVVSSHGNCLYLPVVG